jgi:hypothetical protein
VQDMTSPNNADFFDVPLESGLALKVMDYVHPSEVLQDDRLGPADKRAILCAWASDACAVESRPGFRWLKGTPGPILVDHVLAALRALDDMPGLHPPRPDASILRQAHLRTGKSTGARITR